MRRSALPDASPPSPFPSIAALEAVWGKLNDPRMPEYQKDMAPLIIPGSHRWDVFRVQEV